MAFSCAYRGGAFLYSLLRVFYLEEVAIRREDGQCTVVFPAHDGLSSDLAAITIIHVAHGLGVSDFRDDMERRRRTRGRGLQKYCNSIGQCIMFLPGKTEEMASTRKRKRRADESFHKNVSVFHR